VCGLRGYQEGNVALFENQALVLVAHKNATAIEIKNFVKKISEIVFEKTKIKIECEVLFV
jgi:UDP-N-acetylenolpyruvoylglucosamine reductase